MRGSLAQGMPTGKSWRFHHWIWRGNAYLDDYKEFSTSGMTWSPDERLTFGYDHLDRLTSAAPESGAQGYSQAFQYNAIGNLTSFAGTAYAYNDAAHKHAVTHLGGVQKFWYDANGSMTTRVENGVTYQQAWDAENRLTSVSGNGTTTFTYDGDGARVKKVNASGTTVYVGAAEVLINATQRITRTYYSAGTQLVAMRVMTSTSGNALYYLHTDHLGSTSLTTNSSGGEVARQNYYPFGQIRPGGTGSMPTDVGFTGQRRDASTGGLMFYNARYYSPSLNRWIQPDTIVPDNTARLTPLTVDFHEFVEKVGEENRLVEKYGPFFKWGEEVRRENSVPRGPSNPQALNRYAYTSNNPVKYVDPSGHCWGIFSFIRDIPTYAQTCANLDMAGIILQSDKTTLGEKVLALAYGALEWGAHGALAVGGAGLACSTVAACATAVETGLGISAAPRVIEFMEHQLNRVQHIVRLDHAWDRLVNLSGNLLQDYRAIQPYIQQVVNTGTVQQINTSPLGPVMQYIATINGQQIVVTGIRLANGVFQITDSWVVK